MDKALLQLFNSVLVDQIYYCDGDKITIQFRDTSQIILTFDYDGCIDYGWREYVVATYSKTIGEQSDSSKFKLTEVIYNAKDDKWFTVNSNGKGVIPYLNQPTPSKTLSSKACIWLHGLLHRWGKTQPNMVYNSLNTIDELCGNCDREVTLAHWDVEVDGYKAFCPYCGEKLMLCDMCLHDRYTGKYIGGCDYCSETDSCKHNPPRKEV